MRQILNWFRRRNLESGLDRELHYHVDRRVSDLVQSGVPESEARRQATLELGGLTQIREEVRDVWLTRWLRDFAYDLRFSARSFLRTPHLRRRQCFRSRSALEQRLPSTLWSIKYSCTRFRSANPNGLFSLTGREIRWPTGSAVGTSCRIRSAAILHSRTGFSPACSAALLTTVNLSTGGEHKPAAAEIVSGTYFPVLGVSPALGRVLANDDDQTPERESGRCALLRLLENATRRALADVVGRKVLVNQHPMTVVGVAAPGFRGIDVGEVPSLWIPAAMSAQAIPGFNGLLDRRTRWMQVLGRLQAGRDAGTGSDGAAAVVQGDAGRGHAPRGVPQNHGGAPAAVSRTQRSNSLRRHRAIPVCGAGCRSRSGCCSQRQQCCWVWPA